ncbi:Sugar-specific transcriptional regulator TrmB [Candidatus Bilamarchaeum dharawalense]|uniref:Sugar-specific transcriptional regulator TrmB n=1 Tax=Candidatus Bilamarchaeum dharawalense TaxID=2885759 RepID=A0A5E4LS39_9ARCH|nr:Sugar-specific transcriptional regulator TrmB [Candidatus Bilamarchaeum dharawalense]
MPVDKNLLKELGLTNNEVEVYLKLLMSDSITVNILAERTGMHRQVCYDALDRLLEKGFVSYVVKEGKKNFQALPPEQLVVYAEDMKSRLEQMVPDLKKVSLMPKDETFVEVYKGKNVVRTILRDMLDHMKRTRETALIFGVDESKFKEYDQPATEKYINDLRKFNLREKLLSFEGATEFFSGPQSEYRLLPIEFFNPNPTYVYGDKVVFLVWGSPMHAVMIKSKEAADVNRKQFNILWKLAKKR